MNKYVSSIKECYYLLSGLNVLTNNHIHRLLFLNIVDEKPLVIPNYDRIQLKLTDAMDNDVPNMIIVLQKIQKGVQNNQKNLLSEEISFERSDIVSNSKHNIFHTKIFDKSYELEPDYYRLSFLLKSTNDDNSISDQTAEIVVKIVNKIQDVKFEMYLYKISDGPSSVSDSDKLRATFPSKISKTLVLDHLHNINLLFTFACNITPSELFVVLTDENDYINHYFKPLKKSTGYMLKMNTNSRDLTKIKNGIYKIEILIGDKDISNSIS